MVNDIYYCPNCKLDQHTHFHHGWYYKYVKCNVCDTTITALEFSDIDRIIKEHHHLLELLAKY